MSISKKPPTKSRKQPNKSTKRLPIYSVPDRRICWPDNPEGFVVPQKELEDFIGNQTLYQAQATAERFAVVGEAALAIGKGKDVEFNWEMIRRIVSEDKNAYYQRVMKAMLEAIEKGMEGIMVAYGTVTYLLEFGFAYTACSTNEEFYERRIKRMKRATKRRK